MPRFFLSTISAKSLCWHLQSTTNQTASWQQRQTTTVLSISWQQYRSRTGITTKCTSTRCKNHPIILSARETNVRMTIGAHIADIGIIAPSMFADTCNKALTSMSSAKTSGRYDIKVFSAEDSKVERHPLMADVPPTRFDGSICWPSPVQQI